jgi:dTDP-L-rhamnose 4-epimerase
MNKNVLITGGAGFIGSNLALKLVGQGYLVRVLDNLSPQIHGSGGDSPLYQSIKNKVEFIKGDVRKRDDWARALEGQDIVVHLAAETGTGQSMYEVSRYFDVNVNGTAHLIDLLTNTKHSVQKMVIASSRAIYGEGKYACTTHGIIYPLQRNEKDMLNGDFDCKCPICNQSVSILPTDETSAIHPTSYYGLTKQMQEQMILLAGKTLGISSSALRFQNVYGPGQSLSNPYTGILAIFSNLIRNGQDINIFEDGAESRDFVFIDDVVDATMLTIESQQATGEVYNVGNGSSVTVTEVAEQLNMLYQQSVALNISGNFRIGDIRHNVADISKISRELGYKPKFSFEDGLRAFAAWVSGQEKFVSGYSASLQEMRNKGLLK